MTDEGRERMTRARRDAISSARPRDSWPTPNTPSGGGNLMSTPKHTGGIDLEGAAELWPTPRTTDEAAGRGAIQSGATFYRPSKEWDAGRKVGQANLADVSEFWQTPQVDSFRSRGGDRKDEMGLDQQARLQWVTPASRDYKGANSELHVTETGGGRKHMDQLSNQVEHSFRPDQPTESDGQKSSANAPTLRRRLNTKFVAWLMGLPEGWTSPAPINSADLEIWSAHCKGLLRSLFSSKGPVNE